MTRSSETVDLYHEHQKMALCAVHAVNNLMQCPRFSKRDFDNACLALSPSVLFNPHRSALRIGDFDINVVTTLLEHEGFTITWHDRRTDLEVRHLEKIVEEESRDVGILWNVIAESLWSRMFGGRHWVSLVYSNEQWTNLDSNLSQPRTIGSHEACVKLLNSKVDTHVFFVTKGP